MCMTFNLLQIITNVTFIAFTVVSSLVTAYMIYKSYSFKKNVQRTLHYILGNQRHFLQNIHSNKKHLLSLAEITCSNFKDIRSDISQLKTDIINKFDAYLHKLMHTTAAKNIYYIMWTFFTIWTMILSHITIESNVSQQHCIWNVET